ncbi:MAG: hypothetical protein DDT22_00960 [candidate division WS2 bacterium]|nr:hypothetical protein [Candidatus Lithacetigena glycinireducens]
MIRWQGNKCPKEEHYIEIRRVEIKISPREGGEKVMPIAGAREKAGKSPFSKKGKVIKK